MATTVTISDRLIERLSGAFTELVDTVQAGLDSAPPHPAKKRWEGKALPLLRRDLMTLGKEIDQHRSAESGPLQDRVSQLRFLAREMDGYSLECFGEEVASKIQQSRGLVVVFAWQIFDSSHQGNYKF